MVKCYNRGKKLSGKPGQIEEKNCRDRCSQLFWSGSPVFFFLEQSSMVSLQELFLGADAAEISKNIEPARTMATMAIRIVLLLIFVDLYI